MSAQQLSVLHFIESAGVYGAEKVILNLSAEMVHHARFLPVVGCILQKKSENSALLTEAERLGISTMPITINNKRFPLDLLRTGRMLKGNGISLIHSHGYKPSVFGYIIHRLVGIPVVATCHLWYTDRNAPARYLIMTAIERYLYRYFPKVVCVSHDIRRFLLSKNVPSEVLSIVYNGVEFQQGRHNCTSPEIRSSLSLSDNLPIIINVGRLTEQKSQVSILHAAGVLKKKGITAHFLIAGDGELRGDLQGNIDAMGLADFVKLIGFREDIPDILSIADAFVLPSLDEGLPVALIEALVAKVPVICTPVGEIPYIIKDGINGTLVPVGDTESLANAVESCIRNKISARRRAENAHADAMSYFSAKTMYDSYFRIYQEVLARSCNA